MKDGSPKAQRERERELMDLALLVRLLCRDQEVMRSTPTFSNGTWRYKY